jgi:hypothetical protein
MKNRKILRFAIGIVDLFALVVSLDRENRKGDSQPSSKKASAAAAKRSHVSRRSSASESGDPCRVACKCFTIAC